MNVIKYLIALLLIFLYQDSFAQITIDGTVTDADLNPVNDALVEIIDEDDSTNVYSANTNEQGYFSISAITGIETKLSQTPQDYIVLSNYPNPFNPSTAIYFELPKADNIKIVIYDILGREVRALYKAFHEAGSDQIIWDGRNNRNSPVAAGIYLCRLKTKDKFKVHKMVLLDGGSSNSIIGTRHLSKKKFYETKNVDSQFTFTIRVSSDQIIPTELNHLACKSDTTITLIVLKILKTLTIGSSGGEVNLDKFTMEIPEGAFDSNSELKVFEALSDEYDENTASKIFGVEGIPVNFSKPLNITIEPEKELTGESYISVGHDYEIPFTNSSQIVYKFLETEDTSGFLMAKLSPNSAYLNKGLAKTNSSGYKQNKIYFTSKTGYFSELSYNNHFKIFSPNLNVKLLGNTLEVNYDLVKAVGFETDNINFPVEVYIKKLKPELTKRGCIYYPTYGQKNMSLLIDRDRIGGVSVSSLREYAIGVFRSYDNDFFLPNEFTGKVNPGHYWFHHAAASWLEEKRWNNPDANFYPVDYNHADYMYPGENSGDNRLYPFLGITKGAGNNSKSSLKYGGGMSTLIKYIEKNYGEAPILSIYNFIKDQRIHPVEAIKRVLSEPSIWWTDYLEEYMEGQLYPFNKDQAFAFYDEPSEFTLINFEGGRYKINNKDDTLKIFKNIKFPSLSAKAFLVEGNFTAFDPSSIIQFKLKETDDTMIVYGGSPDDKYIKLGKGASYSGNIGEFLQAGNVRFIIVVINSEAEYPYDGLTNINLEVRIKEGLHFNHCTISVRVNGVFEQHSTYTTPSVDTVYGWSAKWYTKGKCTGYVYDGKIDTELQGGGEGTIKLTLDENLNIVSFNVTATDNDGTNKSEWSCSGANISPTYQKTDYVEYKIYHQDAFNKLTNVYAYYEDTNWNSKMIRYFCDDNSSLEIVLSKF